MEYKDYSPKEKDIPIFENILFTRIILKELRSTKIIELAPALMIISHVNNLDIFFSNAGILCSNNLHYKKACDILENSVMYN